MVLDLFVPATTTVAAKRSLPAVPGTASATSSTGRAVWGSRTEGSRRGDWLDDVALVYSNRLRRSWRLERPRSASPVLHLPARLQEAPEEIWAALESWVRASAKPSPGSRSRAREAARKVFAWMGDAEDRAPRGSSLGEHHDLQPIFDRLNRDHFGGRIEACVRWSPRTGGLSTHRKLEVNGQALHVLTIGRLYDQPDVPVYAIEGVLFHEILHIVHPPRDGSGEKRIVHHREFRLAERAFPGYDLWHAWEMREVPRLIRRLRRDSRRRRSAR